MTAIDEEKMKFYQIKVKAIIHEIRKVIIDKDLMILKVMMAILAKGHILIEDVPGVGKTTLALAFSNAMELSYKRVQFTPDVLPSDVVGFSIYDRSDGKFHYQQGAVFCNLFLADEINRTSPKTQSALLEVMEEGRVTVDGQSYLMPKPYIVIATQNPIGSVGTQVLPESQLDRFMVRLTMGYPNEKSEVDILKGRQSLNPLEAVRQVVNCADILAMQDLTELVFVHDRIYEYVVALTAATRKHHMIKLGISPRGSLAVMRMAKAAAFLHNRDYVIPDDVQLVFSDVAAHRILLSAKARAGNQTVERLLEELLDSTIFPKE